MARHDTNGFEGVHPYCHCRNKKAQPLQTLLICNPKPLLYGVILSRNESEG